MFGVSRVNETNFIGAYLRCGRNKVFIMVSLIKQALFLVTPMDIEIKLFLDQSGRQYINGE